MDWKIVSIKEPAIASPAHVWINPSTGLVYFRLGGTWIPFLSGSLNIDFSRNLVILLNYIDITQYVEMGSISIEDILTSEVNTCAILINDNLGTHKPEIGNELMIFYKAPLETQHDLIFGGRLSEIPQTIYAHGKYQYEITANDFTDCLNKKNVVEVYENKTAGYIIKDIIAKYAPEIGIYYVQNGLTIDYISFNYKFPTECIKEIAELTGYDWYVDYNKYLHFFAAGTELAPYSLTETVDSGLFLGLEINVMKDEIKNKVTVRGGYELSDLFPQYRVADGTQTSFNVDYTPYTPIKVYVDTGGGYVEKTLGIDNLDDTGFDFVVNVSEKVIKNLDIAVLTAGYKLKITYKYKKPIFVEKEDIGSIKMMKIYEGGDGIYEGGLIIDETIETFEQAGARAEAELAQYSNPIVEGSFITNQYGYRSGQLLTVDLPSRGISEQYLIRNVVATSIGNGLFEYEVIFATKLKGLVDFLLMIYDSGRKIIERKDEQIAKYKKLIVPLNINAVIAKIVFVNVSANPYVWSNDEETTPNAGHWNLFTWG